MELQVRLRCLRSMLTIITALAALLVTQTSLAAPASWAPYKGVVDMASPGEGSASNGRIAFQGNDNINTIKPDGTGLRKITDGPGRTGSVEFSPDGTRIAFACDGGGYAMRPAQEICIADRDGSNQIELTDDNKSDDEPSWSPDGEYLVYEKLIGERFDYDSVEIFRMKTDGTEVTQLTDNDYTSGSPDFSPDGTRIVFESDPAGTTGIYSMAPDGSDQQLIIDGPGYEAGPEYSPDGRSIAYYVNHRVKTLDLSTMERKQRGRGVSPSWSPDGRWIVYAYFSGKRQEYGLRKVRLEDAKEVTVIVRNAYSPDWAPRV
jgi:TolB protein